MKVGLIANLFFIMKHYTNNDLQQLEKLFRGNLINSCTGYKSANLIGTKSKEGIENLAIFNSVNHVGSNPPMLSVLFRPTTIARNTYDNIKETGNFTVNHVSADYIQQAHQTSAKYDASISEFNKTSLEAFYRDTFTAPYVKDSPIQLGCSFINEYHIKENDTILVIAKIDHLYIRDGLELPDGWLNLENANTVVTNGLDGYALPKLLDRFSYARPNQETTSIKHDD